MNDVEAALPARSLSSNGGKKKDGGVGNSFDSIRFDFQRRVIMTANYKSLAKDFTLWRGGEETAIIN
uniref:Uncharacterized protein n=1 Tax=Caenorhabditis japonica TaxID=281687 RepID=A0A8R1IM89_CAEJA